MKKSSVLLFVYLFFVNSVVFANNIISDEDYTGRRWYSVTENESSKFYTLGNQYKLIYTFNAIYEKDSVKSLKKFVLKYYTNDIIMIRPRIEFKIDGKTWELMPTDKDSINPNELLDKRWEVATGQSMVNSDNHTSSNKNNDGTVQFNWVLPDPLVKALLATKNDIPVRFFYKTYKGDYFKDYIIPYQVVSSIQIMYLQNQ